MCLLVNNFSFEVGGESKIKIFKYDSPVVASPQKSGNFTNSQLSQLNCPEFTSSRSIPSFVFSVDHSRAQFQKLTKTRKPSIVNARGILPAAYQVLHLLSYPGGVPHPWLGGTPSLVRKCPISGWGGGEYFIPGQEGTPSLAWGYLIPGWGTSIWTWLGCPMSRSGWSTPGKGPGTSHWVPPGKGPGISHWGTPKRTWDQWKYYGM